ncbi:YkvA family protein [Planctomycetota bacterium]
MVVAIGYVALPFDLIPNFLPVIGQVDDVIVVGVLLLAARTMIPGTLIAECRELSELPDQQPRSGRRAS